MNTSEQLRDTFVHDPDHPGSDLAGEMSAALSAVAKAFKLNAPDYIDQLFGVDLTSSFIDFANLNDMLDTYEEHARWLLQFAESHPGKYSSENGDANEYYESYSNEDEPVWAAVWMAYNTETQSDLDHAVAKYDRNMWQLELSWDSKMMGADLLYHKLVGDGKVETKIKNIIEKTFDIPQSPNGLTFVRKWGSVVHAANLAFYMVLSQKHGHCGAECFQFATEQVDYILGDGTGHSLMVGGPGPTPPVNSHHSGAFCEAYPIRCDWDSGYDDNGRNNHFILFGALVGGPDRADDKHSDDRTDYIENEVSVSYNAGIQGAIAGILELGGSTVTPVTTTATTTTKAAPITNPLSTPAVPVTTLVTAPVTQPTSCLTITGATIAEAEIWWGGGRYVITNFPTHDGYSKVLIGITGSFDDNPVDVTVNETWYPFKLKFDLVGVVGSKKWQFQFITNTEEYTQQIGFNIIHTVNAKAHVLLTLQSFKFCP